MAKDQPQLAPDKNLFETIVDGLDKPDAMMRSAIGKALGDNTAPSAKRIMNGAQYDMDALRRAVEKRTGLDLYAGVRGRDNNFLQDAINFGVDAAGYIAISPLSAGLGAVSKGVKTAAKALGTGAELTKMVAGGATGAIQGYLTGDTPEDRAKNAAVGLAVGSVAPQALKYAGKAINKAGTELIDGFYKGKYKEVFDGSNLKYSEALKITDEIHNTTSEIGRKMRAQDSKLGLYDLNPDDSRALQEYMDSKYSQFTEYRNALLGSEIKKSANILDVTALPKNLSNNLEYYVGRAGADGDLGLRYIDDVGNKVRHAYNADGVLVGSRSYAKDGKKLGSNATRVDSLNSPDVYDMMATQADGRKLYSINDEALREATRKGNTYIGKLVKEELATRKNPALTEGVAKFVSRNRSAIEEYNADAIKAGRKTVVPIDFHTYAPMVPDPKAVARGEEQYRNIHEGFVKRSSSDILESGMTLQERLKRESETFYKNFLTKEQKEAMRIVAGVAQGKALNPSDFGKVLDYFDKGTGFLKQQQLTFSHSWIVNNFTDNLVKAYMVGGLDNVFKVGAQQAKAALRIDTGLTKDLLKLTDPKNAGPIALHFDTPLANLGQKYGVVADDFFSEAFKNGSEAYLASRVGVERAKEILKSRDKGAIAKVYEGYSEALKSTVGRTGSLIEQSARLTTFDHVAKNLIENADELAEAGLKLSDEAKKIIKTSGIEAASKLPEVDAILKKAAEVTTGAFFNYGNVSLFEQEVMKRIFPYWTYSKHSVPYWLDAATQGSHIDRATGLLGLQKALGRKPTEGERARIPDYLLSQGARIGENGTLLTFPSLSMVDAINTANFRDTTLSKLHPLLNTLRSLATKTTSLGAPLYPSDTGSGMVKSQSPTLRYLLPKNLSEVVANPKKGNQPYTHSDAYAFAEMVKQNLLPTPIVDTVVKAMESKKKGKSLADIIKGLGPIKTKEQGGQEIRSTLDRRRKEMINEIRKKARRKAAQD